MELYTKTSQEISKLVTERYSTSFSLASTLFARTAQPHIYAIYGLVRIADEIVDTYKGGDAAQVLQNLQMDVRDALQSGYSINPIVHAFAHTAASYGITAELIDPFFKSMGTDLHAKTFTPETYKQYIYGSAEVVGLMCLRVFCDHNEALYKKLKPAAQSLGSAYQKVNFLRDMRADYDELGRVYFPGVQFESFSESDKEQVLSDIRRDFRKAQKAFPLLPLSARRAVRASYEYYQALLQKISQTPVADLKKRRVRVSNGKKLLVLAKVRLKHA